MTKILIFIGLKIGDILIILSSILFVSGFIYGLNFVVVNIPIFHDIVPIIFLIAVSIFALYVFLMRNKSNWKKVSELELRYKRFKKNRK